MGRSRSSGTVVAAGEFGKMVYRGCCVGIKNTEFTPFLALKLNVSTFQGV